jgi:hypothetical protein
LRAIFDDLKTGVEGQPPEDTAPAGPLIRRLERPLMANIFRWTGHFPERTRSLVRNLAKRADDLGQVYPRDAEMEAIIAVTILVTSLAMNYVHRGSYFPETQPAPLDDLAAEKEAAAEKTSAPTAAPDTGDGGEAAASAKSISK